MKITGIHHVAIKVTPQVFPKVIKFYEDLLGLLPIRRWGTGENLAVMLSTGDNSVLEIMSGPLAGTAPSDGALRHIALACDDCEGYGRLMEENGYEIIVPAKSVTIPCATPYPVKICFVKGEAGEIIEFFEET